MSVSEDKITEIGHRMTEMRYQMTEMRRIHSGHGDADGGSYAMTEMNYDHMSHEPMVEMSHDQTIHDQVTEMSHEHMNYDHITRLTMIIYDGNEL